MMPYAIAALVALAKKMPGKLNYGSAGIGTPGHLTAEMFRAISGIDIQHVPYKGKQLGQLKRKKWRDFNILEV